MLQRQRLLALILGCVLGCTGLPAYAAPQFEVLHTFAMPAGYDTPGENNPVIIESDGTIFGTTGGGPERDIRGSFYSLTPPAIDGDPWTYTLLRIFNDNVGFKPFGHLRRDRDGNYLGVTRSGGLHDGGTVFKLVRPQGSQTRWSFQALRAFPRQKYQVPHGLVTDSAGMIYGTTGRALIYSLDPDTFRLTILRDFNYPDGPIPISGLARGPGGVLYGTSYSGESKPGGVYSFAPPGPSNNRWTYRLLARFDEQFGPNGSGLIGGVTIGNNGELYGTTASGGIGYPGSGTVYQLLPPATPGGAWQRTIIYRFIPETGQESHARPIVDANGALYGGASRGGAHDRGVVYRLSPPVEPDAEWTYTVLHHFTGDEDGGTVRSQLTPGQDGALYGITGTGGEGRGVVFRIKDSGFATARR